MVWAIIIILCVAADQLSKAVVESSLQIGSSKTVIDGFLYISNTANKGAAWSFLADKSWGIYLLAGISGLASILMIFLIYKIPNIKIKAAITFICAGAIGNLIDRVFYKAVTDFIELHFWSYHFPTFNIADSLIVCGTIFLAIVILSDPTIMADTDGTETKEKKRNTNKGSITEQKAENKENRIEN